MKRALRRTIRTVAAGLIAVGVLDLGLDYMRHRVRGTPIGVGSCLLDAGLVALGILAIVYSSRLADHWAEDFDE